MPTTDRTKDVGFSTVGVGRCGFRYKSRIRDENRNADLHIFSHGFNLLGLVCAKSWLGLLSFYSVFHGRYFYESRRPFGLSNQLEIVYWTRHPFSRIQ